MSSSALALNSAIIVASDDGFHVNLPDIQSTTWSSILFNRHKPIDAENERLEFIGDALIYLCVALDVYERCPDASPGFLTVGSSHLHLAQRMSTSRQNVRQPLTTNLVLSLLAEKIDPRAAHKGSVLRPVLSVRERVIEHGFGGVKASIPKHFVKASADTMEMALGALYFEKGFDAVRDWVTNTYDPLITAATDALNSSTFYNSNKKRKNADIRHDIQRPLKKLRPGPSEQAVTSVLPLHAPVFEKVFIDLTGDSDDEDDEVKPPVQTNPVWIDLTTDEVEDSSLPVPSSSWLAATHLHQSRDSPVANSSGGVYSDSSDDASIASRTEVLAALGTRRRSIDNESDDAGSASDMDISSIGNIDT